MRSRGKGHFGPGKLRIMSQSELKPHRRAGWRERVERAKATVSIRYTSDSHGQGVHEGQPVSNELVSWVGAGRDQHSSQHFASCRSVNRRAWVTHMVALAVANDWRELAAPTRASQSSFS